MNKGKIRKKWLGFCFFLLLFVTIWHSRVKWGGPRIFGYGGAWVLSTRPWRIETVAQIVFVFSISGGELFERIISEDFELTERDCVVFMRQICDGVKFMHNKQVRHCKMVANFKRFYIENLY